MHHSLSATRPPSTANNPCGIDNFYTYFDTSSLSYPFTGGDRPSFCGPPQFHLNCQNGIPELNISSLSYRVLQFDSLTHSLTLARSDLWNETCTHHYINSTFDGTSFGYGLGNRKLILYYGCKPTSVFTEEPHNLFYCYSNGDKNHSYSLIGSFPIDPILTFTECDEGVEVPILEVQANRLTGNRSLLREVLMKGFNVNYSNPFENDCFECIHSGGQQCGFDSDDNVPICICDNDLCPSSGSKRNRKLIAIGASAAGFGVVFIIMISCHLIPLSVFRERRKLVDNNVEIFMRNHNLSMPRRYSYTEVKRITNSFRDKLGQGGYGVVFKFKASLLDGRQVAVKPSFESYSMHIQHSSLLSQNAFLAYYPPYSSIYNPLETDSNAFIFEL
ncbi:LEAF RUST 10 DISEASE-RESISTANCE LOCUS RECEPTOR-LIKE PROTEIN KINASE 2.4 [Trifolium repens]|nr:LEAF RUST 10 DISEASE-RESISTANCE LOCUS RECEPTOR-LIKE PROTEIN KINASE 2.4 [Trifolium repens]